MAYSALSTKISNYLARELHHSDEQKEILAYAVENIINTIAGFIVIMGLGVVLKAPWETFWAAIAGGILRKVSGGFHCSTAAKCIITGGISYSLLGWVANRVFPLASISPYYSTALVLTIVLCLSVTAIYAPVDSKAKPIVSPQFRSKLRKLSISCVIIFGIIALLNMQSSLATAVVLGLLLQSMSLLPPLNKERGGEMDE